MFASRNRHQKRLFLARTCLWMLSTHKNRPKYFFALLGSHETHSSFCLEKKLQNHCLIFKCKRSFFIIFSVFLYCYQSLHRDWALILYRFSQKNEFCAFLSIHKNVLEYQKKTLVYVDFYSQTTYLFQIIILNLLTTRMDKVKQKLQVLYEVKL